MNAVYRIRHTALQFSGMKRLFVNLFIVATAFAGFASYGADGPDVRTTHANRNDLENRENMNVRLSIQTGSNTFTAKLIDNPTVDAFKALLPLTLKMNELNGNEKYFHLTTDLPTHDSTPGTIHAGDLMIWDSNSVVLFYRTFPTSYSYTHLGRIEDTRGLAAAVGSGNVTVRFEMEKSSGLTVPGTSK